MPRLALSAGDAEAFAACARAAVQTRFPHKLDHLILDAGDLPSPTQIHPVFDGSYDWHSSVHMHWSLLKLLRRAPDLPQRAAIEAHFDERLRAELVEVERTYAADPRRGSFERPYGWGWLLALQAELELPPWPRRWADALRPFSEDVAARLAGFLGRSHYPVRAGTHANSAFAMLLARRLSHAGLDAAIDAAARRWFLADRDYPAQYEPSGADFLSGGLTEALLMREVLGHGFADWWRGFAPRGEALQAWLAPAVVSDRTDPQLVHLDGLNLSRAWCLAALAESLGDGSLQRAADAHRAAAWSHVSQGDFAATHWLVSFALLSLGD